MRAKVRELASQADGTFCEREGLIVPPAHKDSRCQPAQVATTSIGKSAWFKDPDGNTLALFQPA